MRYYRVGVWALLTVDAVAFAFLFGYEWWRRYAHAMRTGGEPVATR